MTFTHWLRSCFAPRPTARTRPHALRLAVEPLEDRLTPSTGGVLDPTFGSGGQVMTSFTNYDDEARAVVAQPDGKIVIAGVTTAAKSRTGSDFLVARYNADGSLDTGFGSGGHTVTDFSKLNDRANAVALQPNTGGKILVAGYATMPNGTADSALARYNANGTLDTTFGNKGKVTTANGQIDSMVVDGSGRILVASVTNGDLTLARYTANGTLDTTFGSGGKLVTTLKVQGDQIQMALQTDGRIVVTSTESGPTTGSTQFVTARFNTNGTLDSNYGTGGVVTTHVGSDDNSGGVTIDGSGRILVAGWESGLDPDGVQRDGEYLLRYTPNGTLDGSFGTGGVVYLVNPSGLFDVRVAGVAVQADGQIVTGGVFEDPAGQYSQISAIRVSTTGSLDIGYGTGGWASTPVGAYGPTRALTLEPDGRLVLVGDAQPANAVNNHPTDVALVRFLASAPQIGSFTASPNPVTSGSSLTLTASNITDGNPNSIITQVTFYYKDSNGNKVVLGYGTEDSSGNWNLTFNVSLTAGTYTIYAQAEDNYGVLGDPDSLSLTVN
jgi:uncharacterized delta-60 repeat protein